MLGKVIVNNLNLYQGTVASVENYMLFVGRGVGSNESKLVTIGQDTDLDVVLGSTASALKTQIEYARLNAGQDWSACVVPLPENGNWEEAADFAMERTNVEGIVLTDPLSSVASVENMQAKAEGIMARYMRPLVIYGRARPMDLGSETWGDYQEVLYPLLNNVVADQVSVTPSIWGYELGTYIGRLCNKSVTVADTPMRVATGTLLGNWTERPLDADGRILDLSVLEALDSARFSVPQWYPGYNGTYWADGNVLDVAGGDYQKIENLRTVQKCMRQIYPLAVARIGDRRLNETPRSIAQHQQYFMKPLREMSKSRSILGNEFPGEIHPPQDGDIQLYWMNKYELEIYLAARPYNCPKKITCNLILDLTNYAA